jgi:SAM-dependent MidA family methyltransferase
VRSAGEGFAWHLTSASLALQKKVTALALPLGYQSEMNLQIADWVKSIATCLKQGVILLFDYGYSRQEYYHPDRTTGTLMCFHQHQRNDNPFINVGFQDITAHVDFTTVIESAHDAGCELAGFTTQAGFLLSAGLLQWMEQSKSVAEEYHQAQAIKRLTLPSQMGELVKVMGLTKNYAAPLIGFSLQDRRGSL